MSNNGRDGSNVISSVEDNLSVIVSNISLYLLGEIPWCCLLQINSYYMICYMLHAVSIFVTTLLKSWHPLQIERSIAV